MTKHWVYILLAAAAVGVLIMILAWPQVAQAQAQNCEANPDQPFCQGAGGGVPGPQGPVGPQGPQGIAGTDGKDGVDGRDGRDGEDGRSISQAEIDRLSDQSALAIALGTPIWLQQNENFAISGSVGFADDQTAFGFAAALRLDESLAGFASIGVTEHGNVGGRVGLRMGFK